MWSIQDQALILYGSLYYKKGSYLKWLPTPLHAKTKQNSVTVPSMHSTESQVLTLDTVICVTYRLLSVQQTTAPLFVLLGQKTRSAINGCLLAVVLIMQAILQPGFPLTHTGPSILRVLAYTTPVFLSLLDQCYSWEKAQKSILVLGTLTA